MKTTTRKLLVNIFALGCTLVAFSAHAEDDVNQLQSVKVARSNDAASRSVPGIDFAASKAFEVPMLDPNPTMPKVLLSEGHKKTCLKRLGDQLEQAIVKDVHGNNVALKDQLSDQLTVLVFWSENSVSGYEQFRRIPVDILAKFAAYRVKVVAVNVGGTVAETRRLTGDAEEMILSLADEDSELLEQFATDWPRGRGGMLPRTYVLDSEGRIVWFDIEYSESTRRLLANALTYFIKQSELASDAPASSK